MWCKDVMTLLGYCLENFSLPGRTISTQFCSERQREGSTDANRAARGLKRAFSSESVDCLFITLGLAENLVSWAYPRSNAFKSKIILFIEDCIFWDPLTVAVILCKLMRMGKSACNFKAVIIPPNQINCNHTCASVCVCTCIKRDRALNHPHCPLQADLFCGSI